MGYSLEALVGKEKVIRRAAGSFKKASVVPLAAGMAMIPLTDALYDEVLAESGDADDETLKDFWKLSNVVAKWAAEASASAAIAYIEADIFGGTGAQRAMVWTDGQTPLRPLKYEVGHGSPDIRKHGAFNKALRELGVSAGKEYDEFEAVGLARYQSTEDWIGA